MIVLINRLTRERWDLPDSINAQPFYLAQRPYGVGVFDVINGSSGPFTVVYDSMFNAVVPAGARWSISTNENMYSWFPVGVDYAVFAASELVRGTKFGINPPGMYGWAPPAQVGNI